MHDCLTDYRREEIIYEPANIKPIDALKERIPKNGYPWREDNPIILRECMEFDMANWKLDRLVPDKILGSEMKEIFIRNYAYLKDLWTTVACTSNFPYITGLDLGVFFAGCDNVMGKVLNIARLDGLIIAAKTKAPG